MSGKFQNNRPYRTLEGTQSSAGFQLRANTLTVDSKRNIEIEWKLATGMKRFAGSAKTFCVWIREFERDAQGQDLIEYALMAGFVAVAAAASMPNINTTLSTVFSRVSSVMTVAAAS
jgi:pilus assembly protein Flp/PilA